MLNAKSLNVTVATAAHYLFHLTTRKIKKVHPLGDVVSCSPKTSRSQTAVGWCKYNVRTQSSVVSFSPWTLMRSHSVRNLDDLINTTVNTAAHEFSHAVIYHRYMQKTVRGYHCMVNPHGKEWMGVMRHEMLIRSEPNRFVSDDIPLILVDGPFWSDLIELFYGWVEGETWNADLVAAAI